MKLLIKSPQDILNQDLPFKERGILTTILLVREKGNSKMTLAKFKASVKIRDIKEELVSLHDRGYIFWSGYKVAKNSIKAKEDNPKVVEIVDYFNKLKGGRTLYKTYSSEILSLLKDYTVEDVKGVISNRYKKAQDDNFWVDYFHLKTITRHKNFAKYFDEYLTSNVGKSLISVDKLNLTNGQVITLEIAKKLSKDDLYNINIFSCSPEGICRGAGRSTQRKGSDLLSLITKEERKKKRGCQEFIYKYKEI